MPSRAKKKQIYRDLLAKEKEDVIKSLQPTDAEMILEELSPETRTEVVKMMTVEQMSYSGPIPHHSDMAEYNKIIPNGADRIMIMAEKQSSHRQSLEKSVVRAKNIDSRLGVFFGGIIGVLGLLGGFLLILNDKPVSGMIFGGTPLATLVGLYLKGTYVDKQDLEEKRKYD